MMKHEDLDKLTDKQKRDAAVDGFVKCMKARLDEKEEEGFHGWDDIKPEHDIEKRLDSKANEIKCFLGGNKIRSSVDVANFAMMIWYDWCKEWSELVHPEPGKVKCEHCTVAYPDANELLDEALRTGVTALPPMIQADYCPKCGCDIKK